MGKRRPNDRAWWEEETLFIERQGQKRYPMTDFANYCDMQARFAKDDGFNDLAERILAAKK